MQQKQKYKETKLYRECEHRSWEAALFVVVWDEGGYLAAGDLDLRVRLTCIAVFKCLHLIDMIYVIGTIRLLLFVKVS